MTKIWLLSDLHQEFVRDASYGSHPATAFDPQSHAPDDFDVVVLAGDIDVPLTREVEFARTRFPGVPVILVPGNHSFFGSDLGPYTIDEQLEAAAELADKYGVSLLENGQTVIDGTRFIGATLWTDMSSVGWAPRSSKIAEARGRFGMNDYRSIKRWSSKHPGKRKPLRPEDTIARHSASRRFIEAALTKPFEGETVVITHHAPHQESLDPRHDRLNWCYASNLGALMDGPTAPDLWVHGHIHRNVDYRYGDTRVASNPRGYAFDSENESGFDPAFVLDTTSLDMGPAPIIR